MPGPLVINNAKILSNEEQEVLATLGVCLYPDLEVMGNLLGGAYYSPRRWMAGTSKCQWKPLWKEGWGFGWEDNEFVVQQN